MGSFKLNFIDNAFLWNVLFGLLLIVWFVFGGFHQTSPFIPTATVLLLNLYKPDLSVLLHVWSFTRSPSVCVCFLSTSQKLLVMLSVNECVSMSMVPCKKPFQSVSPHVCCFWDTLWIHCSAEDYLMFCFQVLRNVSQRSLNFQGNTAIYAVFRLY